MPNLDHATWEGAVVFIDGERLPRPAAFVWIEEGGAVTWVEPSYADPWGAASPALHRRESGVEALPYDPETDTRLVGDALEWFAGWLKANGKTWAEERERLRVILEGDGGQAVA